MVTNSYNMPTCIIDILNKEKIYFYDTRLYNIINILVESSNTSCSDWLTITYFDENGKIQKRVGKSDKLKREKI